MPCGACREFFLQLSWENRKLEIMVDYENRETITLGELTPGWWGKERYEDSFSGGQALDEGEGGLVVS